MERSFKKTPDDGYDFTSKKIKQEGELEVTGVSRSGRVRKKSSKLTDFESLDEIDIRANARNKKDKVEQSPLPTAPRSIKKERLIKEEVLSDVDEGSFQVKENNYSDESENEGFGQNEDSSMESLGSEADDGEVDHHEGNGFQQVGEDSSDDATQQIGLFGPDKNNKKKLFIKESKIINKPKTTPKKDQTNWKVPLKQVPTVKRPLAGGNVANVRNIVPTQTSSTIQQKQQEQQSHVPQIRKTKTSPTRRFTVKPQQVVIPSQNQTAVAHPSPAIVAPSDSKAQPKSGTSTETSVFKPVGTAAADVAAHLKLLGESLTIIGERLTEHEGQIAVSGSLSVLLDSLLCALGPLLCLTQHIPQLNIIPQDQLSKMMDNIAYIMPGL